MDNEKAQNLVLAKELYHFLPSILSILGRILGYSEAVINKRPLRLKIVGKNSFD